MCGNSKSQGTQCKMPSTLPSIPGCPQLSQKAPQLLRIQSHSVTSQSTGQFKCETDTTEELPESEKERCTSGCQGQDMPEEGIANKGIPLCCCDQDQIAGRNGASDEP